MRNKMRKIVGIYASPRNDGNSSAICDAVIDGAMGLSTNIIEIFHLNKLNSTRGCQNCRRCKSLGKCALLDDISPILESIREADSLIIAVPVFFGHAASQYRILEDRMYSFLDDDLNPIIPSGKKVAIIVTYDGADESAVSLINVLSDFYRRLGFEIVGNIMYCCYGKKNSASSDEEILSIGKSVGHKL